MMKSFCIRCGQDHIHKIAFCAFHITRHLGHGGVQERWEPHTGNIRCEVAGCTMLADWIETDVVGAGVYSFSDKDGRLHSRVME